LKFSYLFKSTYHQTFQVWHIIFRYLYVSFAFYSTWISHLLWKIKLYNLSIKINIKILKVYQTYYFSHIWENWVLKCNLFIRLFKLYFLLDILIRKYCFFYFRKKNDYDEWPATTAVRTVWRYQRGNQNP